MVFDQVYVTISLIFCIAFVHSVREKNSNQDITLTFYRSFSTLNEMNVKTIFRDSLISPFCSNLSYMSEDKLSQLSNFKYINIETFKKNGSGIKTPIWFIIYQGIIFFRTDSKSGKIKRIRNNPYVRIAPCDIRGNLKGTWFDGKAKFADSNESSIVFSMIDKKYGFLTAIIRSFNKIRGTNPIAMAIVLD